jgi:cytochrome c biogenesis protein
MAAGQQAASPSLRPAGLDPFRWAWDLLTNVKFALVLVGAAAVAGLVGTVLPQLPAPMRDNAAARQAWLELQREDYGRFTSPMDRLWLFDVFNSPWFNALWALIIVAVTVCAVSRFRPVWRSVHHPPRRVPDRYYEVAHHRASFTNPAGPEAVEAALRRRRYRVERVARDNGATHLFAEKHAWNQYGTFLSHLALLMLLVGALLTRYAGFDRSLILAETAPAAPVFLDPQPGQLFVRVVDAHEGRDAAGNVIDYHTIVEVSRGDETITCRTTVNSPCKAFGYKVHQAAFFSDLARLRITGPDGRLLYDDVLDFETRQAIVPAIRVTDAQGNVLFDQVLPQMGSDGPEAFAALTFPAAPGSQELVSYVVAWRPDGNETAIRLYADGIDERPRLAGQSAVAPGGYRVAYVGPRAIPAVTLLDVPGASSADGAVVVQMPADRSGQPYLFIDGVDQGLVAIEPGQTHHNAAGFAYTFDGRVEASGLSVRRDPGHWFIWVAVGMAIVGLSITFYVPRRRLWVKVEGSRTWLAGIAERSTRFGREMRLIGAELGARDALLPEDLEED